MNRLNKHPHHEVIKAWADGRSISWYSPSDEAWHVWEHSFQPQFNPHTRWRITPMVQMHPLNEPPAVPAWVSVWKSTDPKNTQTYFVVIRDALKLYDLMSDITEQCGIHLDQDRVRFHYKSHENICIAVGYDAEEVISLNIKLHYDFTVDKELGYQFGDRQ